MAITVSVMTGGPNSHPTTSEEANGIATDFVTEGIVGSYTNTAGVAPMTGAFSVNAQGTPDMTVAVGSGVAYVTGTPTSQNSQTFRVYNSASTNVTISANSSGSTKYDWVYIKLDATLLNAPTLAGDTTATIVTSRSTSNSTDDGTPPTYGYPIAVVTVANGASSITNSVIRDLRSSSTIGTVAAYTGWTSNVLPSVSSVTYNGQRSYDVTFGSTVASLLTPGMRVRTIRTVSAPTQCTSLNGSTQYWSKSSPSGVTFTGNFTCSAWVYLDSYASGGIIDRDSAAGNLSGWSFNVNGSGQLGLFWRNASGASAFATYQSLPLKRWVHVAAVATIATPTAVFYIDGVLVPSSSSATGATTLVQATTALTIGNRNSTSAPFPGKIAQAALFSAALTAATVRSYMSQTLSGSETNLVSAYSFNGTANDLGANANNLSASGSATATNADSPFSLDANRTPGGTYDYGIVTKVSTTTATVQVPEGCTIPTSGGVSTVDISTTKAPFGMPIDGGRWSVYSYFRVQTATTSNANFGSFASDGWKLTVPVGSWGIGYDLPLYSSSTTPIYVTISDTAVSSSLATWEASANIEFGSRSQSAAASTSLNTVNLRVNKLIAAQAIYVLYTQGATTSAGVDADDGLTRLIAEFALL